MWYTKIEGIYWKNKKVHSFEINAEKSIANLLFNEILKSIHHENGIFEIAKIENYELG